MIRLKLPPIPTGNRWNAINRNDWNFHTFSLSSRETFIRRYDPPERKMQHSTPFLTFDDGTDEADMDKFPMYVRKTFTSEPPSYWVCGTNGWYSIRSRKVRTGGFNDLILVDSSGREVGSISEPPSAHPRGSRSMQGLCNNDLLLRKIISHRSSHTVRRGEAISYWVYLVVYRMEGTIGYQRYWLWSRTVGMEGRGPIGNSTKKNQSFRHRRCPIEYGRTGGYHPDRYHRTRHPRVLDRRQRVEKNTASRWRERMDI